VTSRFAVGGTIEGRIDPSFILLAIHYGLSAPLDTVPSMRLLVYGPDLAASATLAGLVYSTPGDRHWCNGSVSFNAWNTGASDNSYGEEVYLRTTVTLSPPAVSGSIRYRDGTTHTLSGGALPGAAATYSFGQPARLGDISGRWTVSVLGAGSMVMVIGDDGRVSATTGAGQTLTGVLAPNSSGVGLFDLSFGFGLGGALAYPLASGAWQMLLWWWSPGPMEDILSAAIGRR